MKDVREVVLAFFALAMVYLLVRPSSKGSSWVAQFGQMMETLVHLAVSG